MGRARNAGWRSRSGPVTVDAPAGKPVAEVLARVRRRGGWIVKQQEFFRQFQPRMPEKQYVTGETFWYLGRQYRLRIVERATRSVKLIGRFIYVEVEDRRNRARVKGLVEDWYREHTARAFERRVNVCHAVAKRYGIARPEVEIRRMSRRWGSCKQSKILLNTELVKAPVHCVDYVIMHELCHLREPHHNAKFVRLLGCLLPDWEKRKARLERVADAPYVER